jgi:spore coat polysaccharide biosynthesis protein SpsF
MDLGGEPILQLVVNRARRSRLIDQVVVATSVEPADDVLAEWCASHHIDVVRGDEFDVLDRFHDALIRYPRAQEVVRVTADCPFIDPTVIDDVIDRRRSTGADLAMNRLPPPGARTYPVGLDVEVATREALQKAWSLATDRRDREHVMPYLYAVPGRFAVEIADLPEDLSRFRWTVDTPADLVAVRTIRAHLESDDFSWLDVLRVVEAHPEIQHINADATQKQLGAVDSRWVP